MLNKTEIDELQEFFVENYENIFKAKEHININFKSLGIEYQYDYDTFCKDFLELLIEYDINYEKVADVMTVAFILSKMIVKRMPDDMRSDLENDDKLEEIKKKFKL